MPLGDVIMAALVVAWAASAIWAVGALIYLTLTDSLD